MVNILGEYTQNLSIMIIFTTFINLIMPKSGFDKYIKLVLGFMIIVTIISPLNNIIFKNQHSYIDRLEKYQWDIEKHSEITLGQDYLLSQKEIILEGYVAQLSEQITQVLKKDIGDSKADVNIKLNEDTNSKGFGSIEHISLVIVLEEKSKSKINIPKIKVGNKADKGISQDNNSELEKKIKNSLINFYNLDESNIDITVLKNS